ncbi:MAG: DUF7305 domain-containing protein [Halanaerobiaceae bacterium]
MNINKFLNKQQEEKGAALLLTLILIIVSLSLGATLLSFALQGRELVNLKEKQIQAYYIARSGADSVAQAIIDKKYTLPTEGTPKATGNLGEGEFSVDIQRITASDLALISTGKVGRVLENITLLLKKQEVKNLFDTAIFTKQPLNIQHPNLKFINSENILVGSNGTITDTDPPKLEEEQKLINAERDLPSLSLPEEDGHGQPFNYSTVNIIDSRDTSTSSPHIITEGGYYDLIYLGKNSDELIVDTRNEGENDTNLLDDKEIIVVVDVLYLKGQLTIKGGGNFRLFVTESVDIRTPGALTEENSASFILLAMDTVESFLFNANGTFEGSIYAPDITIDMTSSKSSIIGSIIADKFEGSSDTAMGTIEYKAPDNIDDLSKYMPYQRYQWID